MGEPTPPRVRLVSARIVGRKPEPSQASGTSAARRFSAFRGDIMRFRSSVCRRGRRDGKHPTWIVGRAAGSPAVTRV